jgi:hypothetical protein
MKASSQTVALASVLVLLSVHSMAGNISEARFNSCLETLTAINGVREKPLLRTDEKFEQLRKLIAALESSGANPADFFDLKDEPLRNVKWTSCAGCTPSSQNIGEFLVRFYSKNDPARADQIFIATAHGRSYHHYVVDRSGPETIIIDTTYRQSIEDETAKKAPSFFVGTRKDFIEHMRKYEGKLRKFGNGRVDPTLTAEQLADTYGLFPKPEIPLDIANIDYEPTKQFPGFEALSEEDQSLLFRRSRNYPDLFENTSLSKVKVP